MKLSILVLALSLAGDGGDGPKLEKDQDHIQGTWVVTALHVGGPDVAKTTGFEFLTVEGDKVFFTRNGQRGAKGMTFKLDPTKSPRTIDLEVDAASKEELKRKDEAFDSYKGIYEIVGPRLRLCYHMTKRPTKFESEKQAEELQYVLFELERK